MIGVEEESLSELELPSEEKYTKWDSSTEEMLRESPGLLS